MTQDTEPARVDQAAGRRLAKALSAESIDALIKDAKSSGTPLDGIDGLLNQMTKAVIERALQAELTDHLGYDVGDPAPSSRRESHPPALTDPYVTVSRHTALVVLISQKVLIHAQWAKAFGY